MRTPPFLFSGEKLLYQRRESSSYFLEIEGICQLCPRKYFTHTEPFLELTNQSSRGCFSIELTVIQVHARRQRAQTSLNETIHLRSPFNPRFKYVPLTNVQSLLPYLFSDYCDKMKRATTNV